MQFQSFLAQFGQPKVVAQNGHVFKQGDNDRKLYFVKSGLLKAYYLSPEGKESIKSFIQAQSVIASLNSAHRDSHCTFSLVALQETHLLSFPFSKLLQATKTSPEIAQFAIEQLLNLSMRKEIREYELLSLSAEERYQSLLEKEPDLVKQLTQNDMARYLGITPVALSRIKKRLQTEKGPQ